MGTYTLRLHEVVEHLGATTSIVNGVRVIDKPELLRLDSYDLHESRDRTSLNGLILDTYWNDEIAHETIDIWLQRIRTVLNTEMPTINKLYASNAIKFDPLTTMDMRTTSTGKSDTQSNRDSKADTSTTQNGQSRSTNFDTPSTPLRDDGHYAESGVDGKTLSVVDGTSSDEASQRDATESEGDSHTVGYAGSAAALIQEYQASLVNIDQVVLDALDPLFLKIWGTPHPYSRNAWSM